jgi:polysaccharide biosynthesis transport protein
MFDRQEVAMTKKFLTSSPQKNSNSGQLWVDRNDISGQLWGDGNEVTSDKTVLTFSPQEDLGYGQLFAVLLRHKYWVLGAVLGALGVAYGLSLQMKPNYRSTMQLLVDQNYRGKPEQGGTNPQFADSAVQVDYATQLTLMNSSILVQRIVDRLHPIYPDIRVQDVKKSLSVAQVTEKSVDKKVDTKVFEAAYEDKDPVRAQKILKTVQQVYQDYNHEQQKLRLTKGLAFINDQIPQIQHQLQQSESALENFRRTQNFLNPELQSKALVDSLDNISREQRTNLVQIEDLRTRSASLKQKLALSPQASSQATRLSQSSRYQNLLNEIQKTELALVQERLRFTDRSTSVQKLLEQLSQQKSQLSIEKQRILPDGTVLSSSSGAAMKAGQLGPMELTLASQFTDAEVNLNTALARQVKLASIEQKYRQAIQQFPALLSEYNRLQPAVQIGRETLQQLLKARQDLGLEIARGGFDWQVVEAPKLGEKTGPDLKRNLLLGAVVGLFLGSVLAFLRNAMDDSIHSLDELKKQQTHLPFLGAVPKVLPQGIKLPFCHSPSTFQMLNCLPFRESIDLAYQNIQLLESSRLLQSLVVTSILSGEGKSTLAIGLAMSAARLHKRVLLIDADLRRPSLHKQLDLFNGEGLSTLLDSDAKIAPVGRASLQENRVIQSLSPSSNLDILTAGPIPLDPVKLLSSYQMAELMMECEASYDLVIVDAPPILGIVDTVMISSLCSGVVLVERIGRLHRQDLFQAAAVINRLNVIGVISNGADNSNNRYAYERERDRSGK